MKQYLDAHKSNTIDAFGEMYTEFLKYANNDSNLGIVLTPAHVTDLMCELVKLTEKDNVIDICCGTAGFLIAVMNKMIDKAKKNSKSQEETDKKIENIKLKQLIGIELQSNIHALACANMILHGDGKSHIIPGDSFDLSTENQQSLGNKKLTKALLTPPYKKGASQIVQLEFIENACNLLQVNGMCSAIVQMSCGIKSDTKLIRNKILKKHTLEAVISMPDDLFYPTGVVTCIMVFTAHQAHPQNYKTWFGYLKDDGFEKRKNVGRVDYRDKWKDVKKEFLDLYQNKEAKNSLSVLQYVTGDDEWCAEAYMETDYSLLTQEDFEETLRKYASFLVYYYQQEALLKPLLPQETPQLDMSAWKTFPVGSKDGLFGIKSSKDNLMANYDFKDGYTPYITSTEFNNGVSAFVDVEPSNEGNIITINRGGSVGEAFYQENPFLATPVDVRLLKPKNNIKFNKYIGLFLTTVLRQEKYRFNYSRKMGTDRLKQLSIKLPVDSQGNPDWDYMENYIKTLKYSASI